MPQDMTEDACSRGIVELKTPPHDQSRPLTYDEKKAAEAAFRGEPFNPAWSAAAAKVYAGILSAISRRDNASELDEYDMQAACFPVR
jgi:hypothetical protein